MLPPELSVTSYVNDKTMLNPLADWNGATATTRYHLNETWLGPLQAKNASDLKLFFHSLVNMRFHVQVCWRSLAVLSPGARPRLFYSSVSATMHAGQLVYCAVCVCCACQLV